jgi:hypothetical protein
MHTATTGTFVLAKLDEAYLRTPRLMLMDLFVYVASGRFLCWGIPKVKFAPDLPTGK